MRSNLPVRGRLRALAAVACLATPVAVRAQSAIVTNPGSGIDNISLDQLKRTFLGQATALPNGKPAELAFFTPARAAFSKSVLGLPDAAVKQRWIGLVFRGEATTQPQELGQSDQVRHFVAEHPNGLAFLPVGDVDASVKIVRVDGKKPSDPGYPLH